MDKIVLLRLVTAEQKLLDDPALERLQVVGGNNVLCDL